MLDDHIETAPPYRQQQCSTVGTVTKVGQALCQLLGLPWDGEYVWDNRGAPLQKVKQAQEASFTLDTVGTVSMFGL